jgi:hypothetical protein
MQFETMDEDKNTGEICGPLMEFALFFSDAYQFIY